LEYKDELNEMRKRLEDMEVALREAQAAAASVTAAQQSQDVTTVVLPEEPPQYPPYPPYPPQHAAIPPYPQYPPRHVANPHVPPKYQPPPPVVIPPVPPKYAPPQNVAIPPPPPQVAIQPYPNPYPYTPYKRQQSKWTEAAIGKYLIGIIAALLVFAAAISFIVLLWENIMTDLAIFIIVLAAGFAILTTGFIRLYKHKNAITSILIGTGAGLVYIALAAGHIAFQIIDDLTALCSIVVWSAGLLLSFRFSRLFFISIIAYAGGLISLIFAYTRVTAPFDIITSLVFMIVVLGVFLLSTSLWMDKLKRYLAGVMSLALPLSFIIAFTDNYIFKFHNTTLFWCMLVCCAILYWLYFYIRHSMRDIELGIKSIALEFAALLATFSLFPTFVANSGPSLFGVPGWIWLFVITGITATALIFMYKHSIVAMLMFILSAIIALNASDFVSFGLPVLGVLTLATFFLKDARFNGSKIVTLCLMYISFLAIVFHGQFYAYDENLISNIIYISGALSTVAVSLCLVRSSYKREEHIGFTINTKISAFVISAVLMSTLGSLVVSYRYVGRPYVLTDTVFLAVMALICLAAYYSGFLLDWRKDGAFPYRNKEIKRYSFDLSGILAFSFIFILYAACLFVITTELPWYLKLINTFTALGVLLMQSYVILGRYKTNPVAAISTGILFLLFGWVFLYGWFNIGINSLEASITGMALAFASIFTGVILRVGMYRIFGLILTLCMTAKAILLDIVFTDGVTRVVAFLIGGIICFGISIVYSKLETSLKQTQEDKPNDFDTVTTQKVAINEEINDTTVSEDTAES